MNTSTNPNFFTDALIGRINTEIEWLKAKISYVENSKDVQLNSAERSEAAWTYRRRWSELQTKREQLKQEH